MHPEGSPLPSLSGAPPCRADQPGSTYSLRKGAALRRLAFCTMVAWFRRAMRMREAARRQGSPSTCTGMALPVVSSTSRHCVSLSPWPPTCSAACQVESVSQDWGSGTTVVLWRGGVGTGDTHTHTHRPLTRDVIVKPMTSR